MYRLLVRKQSHPQTVAGDASGFSHTTSGEWIALRFKKTQKRRFHGLHNAVDTDSLMITASRVRARPGGDAQHFVTLVRRIDPAHLGVVYIDKGYISRRNVQYIHDPGAYPGIEPKKRLRGWSRGYRGYKEFIREYRRGLDRWQREHQYGKRVLWKPCSE